MMLVWWRDSLSTLLAYHGWRDSVSTLLWCCPSYVVAVGAEDTATGWKAERRRWLPRSLVEHVVGPDHPDSHEMIRAWQCCATYSSSASIWWDTKIHDPSLWLELGQLGTLTTDLLEDDADTAHKEKLGDLHHINWMDGWWIVLR